MKDIVICGAGGFAREIACLINLINEVEKRWNFLGFIDRDPSLIGTNIGYDKIIGTDSDLNSWDNPLDVVIAIADPLLLKKIAERIDNPNIDFPNIIAPNVTFLDKNNIYFGKGNILCTNCMVSCGVTLGNFNIFNGYIPIGHDTVVGNYNVVMPSVNISGGVRIGDCNFLGVQSVVLQYLKIGSNVRLGANSVMVRNAKDNTLYLGNPAMKTSL